MTETRVIRYRTKLECADENARLIELVFAELAEREVPDLRYEAFRLDEGPYPAVATVVGSHGVG